MSEPTQPAAPLTIAVIGSRGRMGAMLSRHWHAAGHTVRGADCALPPVDEVVAGGTPANDGVGVVKNASCSCVQGCAACGPIGADALVAHETTANSIAVDALAEAVRGADAVALCVPAKVLPAVLASLAPYLHAEQVLFDITSVKMRPMRQMEAVHHGPVVGTHPLFGPAPRTEDLAVALTPGTHAHEPHVQLVRDLFTCFGCRAFVTTAEEHDRGAAFVQGLNFVSSVAYFASLAHREDVLPFLTPSFRRRLEGAKKLLTEDAGMFQGFTTANPMTGDAIHTFRLFLDLIEGGGLPEVVKRARWWYEREEE